MVAPALYLHSSFLPSLLFSSSSLPSSSKSAAQLLPSTHSLSPKPSSAAARGSLPQVMSRGAASRESLSSPGEKEAVHIPSSSWSLPSSSSSSKKSSSASSSLLHSLLSSHKGPSRVKREARPSGYGRSRSRRLKNLKRVKRSRRFWSRFHRVINSHRRYRSDQALAERLFLDFDINMDDVLERDEFRAGLELMGLINNYR
ncbi:hypothetical protein RRG08_031463 [Elysia crispata]|uniref:EF-hand domain-containing protein n=1 Tax=Elysia crispata TaxID=231223 RepID=A0AAE0ZN06_9GAST|nr:hypothetical protein RRG08_031463 [Elysia crispata]